MNVVFLTVFPLGNLSDSWIYADLMRKFRDEGHKVYVVSPTERRFKQATSFYESDGVCFLRVRTLNICKTNNIEKGIATLLLEYQYMKSVKKYLKNIKFDLILYSTPPIVLIKVINFFKKRDDAFAYLMLKDIFPQNAVDLGMIKSSGFIYWLFRKKEIALYKMSDKIGCMSPANVKYVLAHNTFINSNDVELCPNAIDLNNQDNYTIDTEKIKSHYGIPDDRIIFINGGNLGKPQGLDFLLTVIESNKNNEDIFFVIAGSGTEYSKIKKWFKEKHPVNALLIPNLPQKQFNELLQVCDVGLIFLNPKFTIPNYPSRLTSYLAYKKPVISATDLYTDIGRIAEENGYGFSCVNGDLEKFNHYVDLFVKNPALINEMGEKGYYFLSENYTTQQIFDTIFKNLTHIKS